VYGLVNIYTDISVERAAFIFRVEGTPIRGKHLPECMTSHFRRQYIHPRESLKSYIKVILYGYITSPRPALGPTQLPIQCALGAVFFGVNRQGLEADYSPPLSVEVKNGGAIPSLLHTS
jgi:hypothetical protein